VKRQVFFMGELTAAVDEIIGFVTDALKEKLKDIPCDRTVFAKVTESLGSSK
jgi:hypothetical protein